MIKVGIAYEGTRDTDVVKILVSRILESQGVEFEISKELIARTGIMIYVKGYTRVFFETEQLNLAVFLTDQDVPIEAEDRRRRIISDIETVNPTHLDYSAVGVADPHLEQWLVSDQDLLKRIIGLPGPSAIPYADKKPKAQLELLRSSMDLPQLTSSELYKALVTEMDLQQLKARCPDFRLFIDDLIKACQNARRV